MTSDSWTSEAAQSQTEAWLWRVLQKAKNRDMVALLEDTLHDFVLDAQQTSLAFPPRNAFHRRVCHAVACRYGLDHRLERSEEETPSGGASSADCESVRLVLLKTPHSTAPHDRLAQFAEGPPPSPPTAKHGMPTFTNFRRPPTTLPEETATTPATAPQRPAMLLKRPTTADGKRAPPPAPTVSTNPSAAQCAALKNFSEEDYQRARARIFKVSPSTSTDDTSLDPDGTSQDLATNLARAVKIGPIAKGPVEGAAGFERRRTRRVDSNNIKNSGVGGSTLVGGTDINGVVNANGEGDSGSTADSSAGVGTADGGAVGSTSTTMTASTSTTPTSGIGTGVSNSNNSDNHGNNSSNSSNINRPQSPGRSATRRPATPDRGLGDLQDPDFDRSYIKWARRDPVTHASQGAVPVHMFTGMMYPYHAMQSGAPPIHAPPPIHPATAHLRPGAGGPPGGAMGRYGSMPMTLGPGPGAPPPPPQAALTPAPAHAGHAGVGHSQPAIHVGRGHPHAHSHAHSGHVQHTLGGTIAGHHMPHNPSIAVHHAAALAQARAVQPQAIGTSGCGSGGGGSMNGNGLNMGMSMDVNMSMGMGVNNSGGGGMMNNNAHSYNKGHNNSAGSGSGGGGGHGNGHVVTGTTPVSSSAARAAAAAAAAELASAARAQHGATRVAAPSATPAYGLDSPIDFPPLP